jgi:hypothetical protein
MLRAPLGARSPSGSESTGLWLGAYCKAEDGLGVGAVHMKQLVGVSMWV